MKNVSINVLKTRRDAKLRQLADTKPFVQGSLYRKQVRCGSPNCKCTRGEPHEAHVLTGKVAGKTRTIHVPLELREEVKLWVLECRRVKKLIKEISDLGEQIIRTHVKASRAVAQNRKFAEQTLERHGTASCEKRSPSS